MGVRGLTKYLYDQAAYIQQQWSIASSNVAYKPTLIIDGLSLCHFLRRSCYQNLGRASPNIFYLHQFALKCQAFLSTLLKFAPHLTIVFDGIHPELKENTRFERRAARCSQLKDYQGRNFSRSSATPHL